MNNLASITEESIPRIVNQGGRLRGPASSISFYPLISIPNASALLPMQQLMESSEIEDNFHEPGNFGGLILELPSRIHYSHLTGEITGIPTRNPEIKFYPTNELEAEPTLRHQGNDPYFDAILESVKKSKSILLLKHGWDDGSASPISSDTWRHAVTFLTDYFIWAKSHQVLIPAPKIFPTVDGGIDLAWRRPTYRLLIHFPSTADRPADFTGKLPNGKQFEEVPFDIKKFDESASYTILEFLKNG